MENYYHGEINNSGSSPNNVLRSFSIDTWDCSKLCWLLRQLPNLRRLEINLGDFNESIIHNVQPHLLISHLKITLSDPSHGLKKLLKWTPNLIRLRVRGNIGSDDIVKYFEKMAGFLPALVPHLQQFDCELYYYSNVNEACELIIKQFHPLFSKIRCLLGRGQNQCYATDIIIYPIGNEYECK